MDFYSIEGGIRLQGEAKISGAKNSALKLMAASLLARGRSLLINIPRINDVMTMAEVLQRLGASVEFEADVLAIDTSGEISSEAPYDLVRRMRASINVLGPLLAREHRARVAMPGGCNIGNRPLDLHEKGLAQMGVKFRFDHGYLEGEAPHLKGSRIVLDYPSRGATENIMTAATLAEGTTTIENAAQEPDIVDLADYLKAMGASIKGAGTSMVEINGVEELTPASYRVPADPIEAGTFALAALATGGEVELLGARPEGMELFLQKIVESGAMWHKSDAGIMIFIDRRPNAVDFVTLPHPGFPTDLQAPMMSYLSTAEGTSIVTENVFEARFMHVAELNRMGADIRTEGHHAVVKGVPYLEGAPVRGTDLRAGAALVIAGLGARGRTDVYDIHHIERGYEDFARKLQRMGASIDKVSAPDPAVVA